MKNMKRFMQGWILIGFIGIGCLVSAQQSTIDLRDSTSTRSQVIVIRCECECDSIQKSDTLHYL